MAQEPPSKNFCRRRGVSIFGCKAVFSKAPPSFALEGGSLFSFYLLIIIVQPRGSRRSIIGWITSHRSRGMVKIVLNSPSSHTSPFTIVRSWVVPQLASLQDRPEPAPPWAPDFHSVVQGDWDADLQRPQLLVMALLAGMMAEMVVPQVCRSPSGILWAPAMEGIIQN